MTQNHLDMAASGAVTAALAVTDFGKLQARYQALAVAARAQAALEDAKPALQAAQSILDALSPNPKAALAFDHIRKNPAIVGKMRASEAKTALMDPGNDFIQATTHKLAAWGKTMERVGQGEGVVKDAKREYIPAHMPVAAAVATMNTASGYLAVIHLALNEISKIDSKHAGEHQASAAKIRRCATLISDCETASGIGSLVN